MVGFSAFSKSQTNALDSNIDLTINSLFFALQLCVLCQKVATGYNHPRPSEYGPFLPSERMHNNFSPRRITLASATGLA
jgi:hypothetical protein